MLYEVITEKGAEIVKKEKNPYRKAEAIYKWVTGNVAWKRDIPDNRTAGETLAALNGDSQDLAVLFCALARAQGIPSIPVAGLLVDSTRNSAVHWWAEFYVEGFGWVPVDLAIPAGGATAGEGGKTESVITSYSIHYTKLYDQPRVNAIWFTSRLPKVLSVFPPSPAVAPPAGIARSVITSYSIHYTKLYENSPLPS